MTAELVISEFFRGYSFDEVEIYSRGISLNSSRFGKVYYQPYTVRRRRQTVYWQRLSIVTQCFINLILRCLYLKSKEQLRQFTIAAIAKQSFKTLGTKIVISVHLRGYSFDEVEIYSRGISLNSYRFRKVYYQPYTVRRRRILAAAFNSYAVFYKFNFTLFMPEIKGAVEAVYCCC